MDELQSMSLVELKSMAKDLDVVFHPKASKEQIAAAIHEAVGSEATDLVVVEPEIAVEVPEPPAPPPPTPVVPAVQSYKPDAPVKSAAVFPTVEEVEALLVPYKERGLVVEHLDAVYWQFKKQNRQAAGNMKMPLSQIRLQLNILMTPTSAPTEE